MEAIMQTDILGVTVGVIGILISIYTLRKSIRVRGFSWAIISINIDLGDFAYDGLKLQDGKDTFLDLGKVPHDALKLQAGKETFRNLTVSRVLFWNHGSEEISNKKIVNEYRIAPVGDVKILDAWTITRTNPASEFDVKPEPGANYATISFKHLYPKEGGLMQIIHTGTSSGDITVEGNAEWLKSLSRKYGVTSRAKPLASLKNSFRISLFEKLANGVISGFLMILGIGALFVAGSDLLRLILPPSSVPPALSGSPPSPLSAVILWALLGGLMLASGVQSLRNQRLIPQELFDATPEVERTPKDKVVPSKADSAGTPEDES
jgi:hypothetical protein